jgi:hypothetical protein
MPGGGGNQADTGKDRRSGPPIPRAAAGQSVYGRLAELAAQVLDAVDEAGQQPVWLCGSTDVRHAAQQFAQDRGDLALGQVGAQAAVRAG